MVWACGSWPAIIATITMPLPIADELRRLDLERMRLGV
jgi:hypothetical protein